MKDYIVPEGSAFDIDWEAFRRDVAKDILVGFASSGVGVQLHQAPSYAVELADELIKQLKED